MNHHILCAALLLAGCGPADTADTHARTAAVTDQQTAEPGRAEAEAALTAVFDAEWEAFLRHNPVQASGYGERRYGSLLPDVGPDAQFDRFDTAKSLLARLESIDTTQLADESRINRDMMHFILYHRVALAPYKDWRVPLLSDDGFHFLAMRIPRLHPFETASDYRQYLDRLEAIPDFFNSNIRNMQQGIADGVTMPSAILPGVMAVIKGQQWPDNTATPFWRPFRERPAFLSPDDWDGLKARAARHINSDVIPAYAAFLAFMTDVYAPAARSTIGATDLPDGEAYYRALIHYFTNLDISADAVHQIGLSEVARIRKDMQAIIDGLDFDGSFADFIQFLRTDPRFYPESADDLMREASYLAKQADAQLPKFFAKLPRQPYAVVPVPPEIAPNYTAGRYSGAPLASTRGGEYWVNTYALKSRPLYALPALTLHEAVPGHHLQTALGLELQNVPNFRKDFYPHAFGEGWGLYSEKLGVEMGFYKTPYDDFGRLTYEMWRACRLVVDTGMHAKGWTRQQARDYLAANTALSLHEISTEIDRYIAWPGQALAYKMGELKIWELRRKAEDALGPDFDIRTFHDAVIASGGIPLGLLEQQIDRYIDREKGE